MAAVLSYSTAHRDEKSMHPFFRTVLNQDPTLPPLPISQVSVSKTLDGADDVADSPSKLTGDEAEQPVAWRHSKLPASHFSEQPTRSDIPPDTEQKDIDPNYDRRKRLRTGLDMGPADVRASPDQISQTVRSIEDSWQVQLENAAKNFDHEYARVDVHDGNYVQKQTTTSSGLSEVRRSPRHTYNGRPTFASPSSMTPASLTSPNQPEHESPEHKTRSQTHQATPSHEKMVKLSANGKLSSSSKRPSPSAKPSSRPAPSVRLKRGKISSSLTVVLRYGRDDVSRARIGGRINNVLDGSSLQQERLSRPSQPRTTHPFFLLGGTLRKTVGISSDEPVTSQNSDSEISISPQRKGPIDWKDLGFTKRKPLQSQTLDAVDPIWPPNDVQHLGRESVEPFAVTKRFASSWAAESKQTVSRIFPDEDVLNRYAANIALSSVEPPGNLTLPTREVLSKNQVVNVFGLGYANSSSSSDPTSPAGHDAIHSLRARIGVESSGFDQGTLDCGQFWINKYAPRRAIDVLQSGSLPLRDWLSTLKVRDISMNAKSSKKAAHKTGDMGVRKRRRKTTQEIDDFIASSEDDSGEADVAAKNAMLITGPSGCGKTASVYAVAHELNFEVFEIHPGMRRNARDIFDKVGDMTQNHLVQKAASLDRTTEREGSVASTISGTSDAPASARNALQGFFVPKKKPKPNASSAKLSIVKTDKQQQKQQQAPLASKKESLVLFEEVDILFEEDRSFWSGVIALIQQSKRPVIMTCNDLRDIPLQDLSLHTILYYVPPPTDLAAEYIALVAAKEGHWLEQGAIATLYESKGRDLRATMVELDFWCQMTIGSQQGGLDWTLPRNIGKANTSKDEKRLHVFSKGTYTRGLDLLPRTQRCATLWLREDFLLAAAEEFQIPLVHWHEQDLARAAIPGEHGPQEQESRLRTISRADDIAASISVLDVASPVFSVQMSVAITRAFDSDESVLDRTDLLDAFLFSNPGHELDRNGLVTAFAPLAMEKPTFPPSQGRLAPSLEGSTSSLAVDVAPYVRSIVAFDQRLEQQRDEMAGGLQGKKIRTTRAARAALEGGNKANTRCERWFPKDVNFDAILGTGGDWPRWYDGSTGPNGDSAAESPASQGASSP